ncbi:MAG: hypothetical protein LBV54_05240 [Puniceicoccales bacterium]|jgi:hypothetical protein|nr:hypothetical protein [Puniceicoccales bacterium]
MANENEQNPQQQVISLQAISQNFLGALQRQFDLLAYNLAASQQVEAEKYEGFARQVKIMPVQQLHLDFGQIQAYSRGLLSRQTINDLLNMAAACLDNCHLLCQLIRSQSALKANPEEANKKLSETQGAFVRLALQDKFEAFEREFEIMCELEDALIAIAISLRVLMARNGVVAKEDVNADGELVFEFKTVQTINPPKGIENQQPEVRIVDTRRAFHPGDRIELSNSELLSLSITIASFFHNLFRSVDEYGRKILGEQAPPPATAN